MTKHGTSSSIDENRVRKLEYRSPGLVCFGKVGELTQAGTQNGCEEGQPTVKKTPKPACQSDPCLKENVVRIGSHPLGIGLYLFDYKSEYQAQWGYDRQFGVMADEVETVMPEAVSVHPDGYRMVNYAMLGVERTIH